MAKHQRRSFATDYSPQPYHDEMHRQSSHQKSKLVTKPNLRYAKNPTRSDARKNRYGTGLIKNSKPIDLFLHFSFGNTNDIFITFDISPLCIRLTRTNERKNTLYRNPRNEGHHAKFKNHTYTHHQSSPPQAFTPPESYYIVNATEPPTSEQVAVERERIRTEFFATYDAMTGVRIATTLGGFFGLMVFLVIYKSRGERIETENALKVSDAKVGNKTKH